MKSRLFGHTEKLTHLPTVLLMGRTNAGKSTLFNRLIKRRKNIVFDEPGVTRDFLEGKVEWEGRDFRIIDTAGFEAGSSWSYPEVQAGLRHILKDADLVIYLIDGREDVTPIDRETVRDLQKSGTPFIVAINKIESGKQDASFSAFYELGVDPLYPVSSEHALGIHDLLDAVVSQLPPAPAESEVVAETDTDTDTDIDTDTETTEIKPPAQIKVAIVGRPNVGKSTLCNRLFGGERVIVSNRPGTTRDAVEIIVDAGGRSYRFIDTAGIRRPGKRESDIERISVAQSIDGIGEADVIVWVVDAAVGLVEQDKKIIGKILEVNKPFIAVFNKWDAYLSLNRRIPPKQLEKKGRQAFEEECPFAAYAPFLAISAQKGTGVAAIFPMINRLYDESHTRFSTGEVNRRLEPLLAANPPPSQQGRVTRVFYGTQVSSAPPTFVFFVNNPKQVRQAYRRFLENVIRREFSLHHVPVHIIIRGRSGRETV